MNRLSRRLERLEAAVVVRSNGFRWDFDRLQRTAIDKLPVVDHDLLITALAAGDMSRLIEARPDLWECWEQAIYEAAQEIRFPFDVSATDLLL